MGNGSTGGTGRLSRRDFLKVTGAGLTGAALLGAAGCGDGDTGQAPSTTAEGKVRIALFGSREDAERREKLIPPFKEKFPKVDVEYVPIEAQDWEAFFSKVLAMIAAGNPPDLTFVATEGTHLFAGEGLAVPLDDYVKRDKDEMQEFFSDVHPSLIEAMMYEGSLYELPIDFNAANMYYNTSVLEEAGIDRPEGSWDKDTFYDITREIAQKTKFGYAWVNRLWGSWTPWIFANDSNLLAESKASGGEWLWDTFYADDPAAEGRGGGYQWGEPKANDPANVEALEFMVELTKEGLSPKPELGGGSAVQGFFTSGQVGMTPAGGFWAGGLNNAGMKPGDFDVQYFPKWKIQRHLFGTAGYVLMKDAEDKDLGWEYIKYLSSKEAMVIDLGGNATTPTRRSMMTAERYEPTGPKNWEVFYNTLDEFPNTAPIPAPPEANPMTNILTKQTSLAMSMEQTPRQALDGMQKQFEELFSG